MSSNQAAWLDGAGQKLRVADADLPKPGADEVVIKNGAIAINPVDWKIQDYGFFVQKWPTVLGQDVAGEVVEVGSNVKDFTKGDRVLSHVVSLATGNPANGGFQLYTAAPAATTAKIPKSASFTDASVLPLAFDTAAVGLYSETSDGGGLGLDKPSLNPSPSSKTVVVWGGSSSVGALVIQLAVASGASVVAVASSRNHDFVKRIGASSVYDYNSASIDDDVIAAVKSSGGTFAGVYDAISVPESYPHTLAIAEKLGGGNVVTTLPPAEKLPTGVKSKSVFAVNPITHSLWKEYIPQALEQGKLLCVPEASVIGKGLEAVQAGLDANKKGVSAKKVVVEL